MVSSRTESLYEISRQGIGEQLGRNIVANIPPAIDIAYQAAAAGMAITQFQPDSEIALEISKLVKELVTVGL